MSAHVPNHATCKLGVKNNYIFGILNPQIAYSLCNLYEATMTIRGRLQVRILQLGGFKLKSTGWHNWLALHKR